MFLGNTDRKHLSGMFCHALLTFSAFFRSFYVYVDLIFHFIPHLPFFKLNACRLALCFLCNSYRRNRCNELSKKRKDKTKKGQEKTRKENKIKDKKSQKNKRKDKKRKTNRIPFKGSIKVFAWSSSKICSNFNRVSCVSQL